MGVNKRYCMDCNVLQCLVHSRMFLVFLRRGIQYEKKYEEHVKTLTLIFSEMYNIQIVR